MPRDDQFEQSRVQVTMAVTDCLHRYARAVDRCDWDSVRACYHDNAFDHHGAYRGGVDGLIEDMKVRHAQLDSSVHFITNVLVDLPDPDVALVESYCLCYLRRREQEASGAQQLTTVKCRYLDKFTPDAVGRWRIASRMVVFDELCVGEVRDSRPQAATRSERDRKDPLWVFLDRGADWNSADYAAGSKRQ
ncbi:nuclear transport factor 2 family protein [Dactylosporangium sp. NPDC005555]|uniref:nuclear transport factor 2 family protein n=1 Tax=Dactylosporangium sp. NPDC005555 TaxID=3154889 RepID=UPI0033B408F6